MRILLVNPPWQLDQNSVYSKTGAIYPPLGLASMATVMDEAGLPTDILDAWGMGMGLDSFQAELIKRKPDVLGITAYTTTVLQALAAARKAKETIPGITVVMGGPHPTIMPEEMMEQECVDYIIRGEGEFSFLSLVRYLQKNIPPPENIPGLSWRENGLIRHAPNSGFVEDLNSLPVASREKLPMSIYRPASGAYRRTPVTSMITSRGCPFNCTFCSKAIFGSTVRFRTAEKVVEEAKYLRDRFGIKEIYFADDCFTLDLARAGEICDLFLSHDLDMTWTCSTRVNLVNPVLLKKMKQAGCVSIGYGIETGDPEMAKKLRKGITIKQARDAIAWTRSAGIETRSSYIFGFPGEDMKDLENTLRVALELNADFVIFNLAIPLPGTELYREAKDNGLLPADGFDLYPLTDGAHVLIRLPSVTPDQLKVFYDRAYRRYYLRPRYIFTRLSRIKNFEDLRLNWRGLKEFLAWRSGG